MQKKRSLIKLFNFSFEFVVYCAFEEGEKNKTNKFCDNMKKMMLTINKNKNKSEACNQNEKQNGYRFNIIERNFVRLLLRFVRIFVCTDRQRKTNMSAVANTFDYKF